MTKEYYDLTNDEDIREWYRLTEREKRTMMVTMANATKKWGDLTRKEKKAANEWHQKSREKMAQVWDSLPTEEKDSYIFRDAEERKQELRSRTPEDWQRILNAEYEQSRRLLAANDRLKKWLLGFGFIIVILALDKYFPHWDLWFNRTFWR